MLCTTTYLHLSSKDSDIGNTCIFYKLWQKLIISVGTLYKNMEWKNFDQRQNELLRLYYFDFCKNNQFIRDRYGRFLNGSQ